MLPLDRRSQTMFVVADFAENVTVVRKFEVADQYFHRAEILLFGGVISIVIPALIPGSRADLQLHTSSHLVSSDYR